MVKFNKPNKSGKKGKVTKHIRNLSKPESVKYNKPLPVIEKCYLPFRFKLTVFFISAFLLALVARAGYVQHVNSDFYSKEADKRSLRSEKVLSIRGSILDRNGVILSSSVPMKAVELNPKQLMSKNGLENTDKIKALADVLGMKYSELVNKIKKNENSTFMYLARQLELEKADYIKKLKIEGISFKNEYRRFYPRTEEIAHLIGYTDIDGNGIEGVEKSFNDMLIGKDGERLVRKDARGRVVEHIADEKKYDAQNVMLSVDDRLQGYVYRELKKAVADNNADAGTAILVDIRTGEVLAMANAPSFNPNDRRDVTPEVMRNRAITDTFEPGSTVKPFVVLTALEKGTVGRNAVINTAPFKVNGKEITDVAPRPQQTLDEILVNSSNRGVSRLSLGMPISDLMNTYKGAGFGRPTDLGLIGEQAGLLNADRKRWSDLDRATISYGYGLTVTPLQLVRAYATLGSFGIYRPLSITKVDPPVIGQRVFSEKVSKEVVNILEKVAIHNKKAMVEGYRVGIKTGTAKKTAKGGGYAAKYLAYTVGIAPVSDPRYALVVMIDEPKSGAYYGGAVSAPVFSTIMSYALRTNGIAPDAENTVKASKSAKRIVYVNDHKNETVN